MKKIYLLLVLNSCFITLHSQNFQWAKREGLWAYDYGYGITTDNAGNVYVAGKYEMDANFSGTIISCEGNHDIYLVKYTPSGSLSWIKTAGGNSGDYATCVATDGSNYVYIAGEIEGWGTTVYFDGTSETMNVAGFNDIFLAKYDLEGNILWAKRAGGTENEKALGITCDSSGNIYICGFFNDWATFESTTIYGYGANDIFLAKYDADGNFLWAKKAGGTGRDEAKAVAVDALGNVYICGMFKGTADFSGQTVTAPNGYFDMFLAKYDANGNLVWLKTHGANYDDVAWSLAIDNSGKIYITGEFNDYVNFDGTWLSTSGESDVFVACYNSSGSLQWVKKADGDFADRARGIGTDGTNTYITGQFGGTASFGSYNVTAADSSDIFMAALNSSGNFIWATTVGGVADSTEELGYESGNAICADAAGYVYATGSLLDGGVFGNISYNDWDRTDIFVTKLSPGADITPPLAVSFNPADNSTAVSPSANLQITFNEPVQKGNGNIVIKEGGSITQTISVSGSNVTVSGNTATINPGTNFSDSAAVNIEMAAGVFKDMTNNNFAGISNAATWNFSIAAPVDATPPTVISLNPPDNSVNVVKNSTPVITFSEPIQKGSGNIIIKEGGIVSQTIDVGGSDVTVSGNTVTINSSDFSDGAEVNIEMAAGVFKDLVNNSHTGISGAAWNFTVEDLIAPIAVSYTPPDNATGVAKNANLIIIFSEDIQKGSGNIIIKEAGIVTQTIDVAGSNVTISGNAAAINPSNFTEFAEVNVEMDAGVFKDLSGNNFTGINNDTLWNFSVIDLSAPMTVSFSPADNSANVPHASTLEIKFNEDIQKGSGNILIKQGATTLQTIDVASANVMVFDSTAIINPASPFPDGAALNVQMAPGVFKNLSNINYPGISNASTWNFTVADTTAPFVASFSPADNAVNVSKSTNLILTFNENIQKGSGNILLKENGITIQTITVSGNEVAVSGNTATINPASDFTENAAVNVEIAAGVFNDISGNSYAGISNDTLWNFTVEDATAPVAVTFTPAQNSTNVAKNAVLVITFSEDIQKGSGNIVIKEDGITKQTIAVSGSNVVVSGNAATINSTADFTENSLVNIRMASGVFKDLSNNNFAGITSDTAWKFSISDLTAPTAVTFSPADNSINIPKTATLAITFSENIQKGSGNIIIKEWGIATQTIPVSGIGVTVSGNTATIIPPIVFSDEAWVSVEMAAGVFKDMSNNNFAGINGNITWSFSIADVTAPTASSFSPANYATGVPKNTNLIITFSENIKKGSGNIIIKEEGVVKQTIAVSGAEITVTGNKATINPSSDFSTGAWVNIEMASGVFKDMSSNNFSGISQDTIWNFTVDKSTSITQSESTKKFSIYPNPGKGKFILDLNEKEEEVEITIINSQGKLVLQRIYTSVSEIDIDLSAKQRGVYYVEINSGEPEKLRGKIILQ